MCLLIFFGLPAYLSSAGGTRLLLGKINGAMDGQVGMDNFSIGWFRGVELTNLSYDDTQTSLTVQRVRTHPRYASLLGGQVRLGRTVVEAPRLHLKVPSPSARPATAAAPKTPADGTESAFSLAQMDLEVMDGAATLEMAGDPAQTVRFANIASTVKIADASASSVALSATVDETATVSAKGSATPSKTGWTLADGDFSVQVSKLELASLKPLFALAGRDMDMTGQLNADATVQVAGGQLAQLDADATIHDFAQGTGEARVAFDKPVTLTASTRGSGDSLQIESLSVDSDFLRVSGRGTLDQFDYTVAAELGQTTRFAGQFADLQGLTAKGDLNADGTVTVGASRIDVTANGQLKQLVVQKDNVATAPTDVTVNLKGGLDQAADQLNVESLDLTSTPATVTIRRGVLPLSARGLDGVRLDAEATVDLARAWPFVQVFAKTPPEMQLAGDLTAAVAVTTEDGRVRLKTDRTQVKNLRIARGDDAPFVQEMIRLTGDVELDMDQQTVEVRTLEVRGTQGESLIEITKGRVGKKVSGANTTLTGDVEAAYDWKTVSALTAAYLPDGLTLEGRRQDSLTFTATYPTAQPELMTGGLDANATVGFDRAHYNGLHFGPTSLSLAIAKGVAEFSIPQAVVNDGAFQFAARVDLAETPPVLRLTEPMQVMKDIHLNDELTGAMLKYLSPMFAKQSNISGFASLRCEALAIPFDAARKNDLVVDGVVSMDRMKLQAVGAVGDILARTSNRSTFDAKLLPSRFVLKDGVLRYDAMEFHLDQYPVGFGGEIRLDNRLDMAVLVPYRLDTARLDFATVKVGDDLSSRLSLPVDGTVNDPKIRLDKLFESILKKHSGELIQRGLEDLLKNL